MDLKQRLCNFIKRLPLPRLLGWLAILLLCLAISGFLLANAGTNRNVVTTVIAHPQGDSRLSLAPGDVLSQEFTVQGRTGGLWEALGLDLTLEDGYTGTVQLTLTEVGSGTVHFCADIDPKDLMGQDLLSLGTVFLASGRHFAITLVNNTDASLSAGYHPAVQSGKLSINGEQVPGFLNYTVTRTTDYWPTPIFYVVLLTVNLTVLAGSWLVLFTKVKLHMLYLLLALGFGFAMLFALTPLYGFDMRFQFDSAYVLSNELLGLEGTVMTPSLEDPEANTLSYYRRYGDDYTHYAHHNHDYVSANYTDTYWGIRNLRFSQEDRELVLVQTYQGAVGEQLYLYLPQALGFAAARLWGISLYPMLQMARVLTYGLFVLLTFLSIRQLPFGKGILLILALMPATMIQAVSINRDSVILSMCFYLTAKVLAVAYGEGMPTKWDWLKILAVSMLLAPCKMVYLPASFLWLLIIYRKYLREQKLTWKKALAVSALLALPILAFFLLSSLGSIAGITQTSKTGLNDVTAYSMAELLTHPLMTLGLVFNTFRDNLGSYFVNAISLFDLGLGSSDGITLAVLFLLLVELFREDPRHCAIRKEERGFALLVFLGVFALVTLASMQWTPNTSTVIEGLQGRYLTPVLPLLGFALLGCPLMKSTKAGALLVRLGCCLFPGIVLLNMYLWTVGGENVVTALFQRFR